MSKKLFLHIGHQKCGSTTIQHWLQDHQGFLSRSGMCYLKSGRNGSYVHHRLALEVISGKIEDGNNRMLRQLAQEINNSPVENLIISAENFIQINDATQVQAFKNYLPKDLELHLVFIVRKQYKWLGSQWAQLAKTGTTFESYDHWLSANARSLRALKYNQICDFWQANLNPDSIHVMTLEDLVTAPSGLIGGFFNSLSLPVPPERIINDSQQYNVSPSYTTILLCQKIFWMLKQEENLSFLFKDDSISQRDRISSLIQRFAQSEGLNKNKTKPNSSLQEKDIYEHYKNANLELSESFSSPENFQNFLKSPSALESLTNLPLEQPSLAPALVQKAILYIMAELIRITTNAHILHKLGEVT